jgi:hypothetical protein
LEEKSKTAAKYKNYSIGQIARSTDIASNVLMHYFRLNDRDWKNFEHNFDDIIDYISDAKKIKKENHEDIGRLMRIVYYEYSEFLSNNITRDVRKVNDDEYRRMNSLVKIFNSEKKEFILKKYLKTYEAYEKSF